MENLTETEKAYEVVLAEWNTVKVSIENRLYLHFFHITQGLFIEKLFPEQHLRKYNFSSVARKHSRKLEKWIESVSFEVSFVSRLSSIG